MRLLLRTTHRTSSAGQTFLFDQFCFSRTAPPLFDWLRKGLPEGLAELVDLEVVLRLEDQYFVFGSGGVLQVVFEGRPADAAEAVISGGPGNPLHKFICTKSAF